MIPHPDCVPCLLKRVLFQARLVSNDVDEDAVRAAVKTYAQEIDRANNSAKLATLVHKSAYAAMGTEDPYIELKIRADEVAGSYLGVLERFISASDDSFAAAVRVSILGNVMDFGSGIAIDDPDEFGGQFEDLLAQGIESDDTEILKGLVTDSESVVYIFDNCGEDQFDKLLIREIRKMGKRVVGVVRGAPILNDVTISDAKRIGLDLETDSLLTTNAFAIGIDLAKIDASLRKEIKNAGVIIAKGMANYESLSDEKLETPVAYLMRAKCKPVADSIGVSIGTNVVRVQM